MPRLTEALRAFVNTRPGLEFRDYGDVAAYRADSRRVAQQRRDALALLDYIESCLISDIHLQEAAKHAFSGRLTISSNGNIDYCAGQCYQTEYRRAVAVVLASAVWEYLRDYLLPDGATADDIRAMARQELGRSITNRYFN